MIPAGRQWVGWLLAVAMGWTLVVLATLPLFVGDELGQVLMAAFSRVCHQIPARSPHIDGTQLAVCHRCLGTYAALAASTIGFTAVRRWDAAIHRHAGVILAGSLLVPGADWLVDVLGLWSNTPWSRTATGAVFGLTVGYFLARALVELFAGRAHDPALGRRPSGLRSRE